MAIAKKKAAKRAPARTPAARAGAKRGPKADVLKIEGNWRDAMKKSLQKKKPPEGWPK
jgi:hypothetical protein